MKEQQGFESKLLACEARQAKPAGVMKGAYGQARFRKIERLSARLTLPNTVVTAVAADLLRAASAAE